ncbi:hypothetical protein BC826DRAFT_968990 [Russula brevipes]|nr:hypothetical protein BC826DRAFT_968990 [Russula brevipes]
MASRKAKKKKDRRPHFATLAKGVSFLGAGKTRPTVVTLLCFSRGSTAGLPVARCNPRLPQGPQERICGVTELALEYRPSHEREGLLGDIADLCRVGTGSWSTGNPGFAR